MHVARSRLALALALLLSIGPAAAQATGLPAIPPLPTEPAPLPPVEAVTFSLEGSPASPQTLTLLDKDGTRLFEYAARDDGKARVTIGSTVLLDGATLIRTEGSALDDAFTLVLREPGGEETRLRIERAALLAAHDLDAPPSSELIVLARTIGVDGGPRANHLLRVQDARPNFLDPTQLNGQAFLQRSGSHAAFLQMPSDEASFTRIVWNVTHAGTSSLTPFTQIYATDKAAVWRAQYSLPDAARDGDVLTMRAFYEKRPAPFAVERFDDPQTFSVRLDGTAPTAQIMAPTSASALRFNVSWLGSDALTGISGYDVQWREGSSAWTPWITSGKNTTAPFSGDWGRSYAFRARSLDGVGNPSGWAEASTTIIAKPSDTAATNQPPVIRLTAPRAGDELTGIVTIAWTATDPDGEPVFTSVEVSSDNGATWRTIYSGPEKSVVWNTGTETDAPSYRVRVTATDGALSASDASGAFAVRNVTPAKAPSAPGATPSPTPAPTSASPSPTQPTSATPPPGGTLTPPPSAAPAAAAEPKSTPAIGLAVLLALVAFVAALMRRK